MASHRSDDGAHAVVLQGLRPGTLEVHEVALAAAEARLHLGRGSVDGADGREVEPLPMARVLEHGERLPAVVHQHGLAAQHVPAEVLHRRPPGEEEAILLVDLGEVHGGRRLALLERAEGLRGRRLPHVHGAVHQPLDGRLAWRRHRVARPEPLLGQEATGNGGDERSVEGREAGELNADVVTHGEPPWHTIAPA